MQKTFKIKTVNGHHYQLLALPGINVFTHLIKNPMGSHIEKVYDKEYGKNVYGIAHLIEHLGFRSTADFSTDELMSLITKEGTYNAATDHEYINYFFKTTMCRRKLASKLVCNYAFNDLTTIPEAEFNLERDVVGNEVKRYLDADQTMFYWNVLSAVSDYHVEDNVIGVVDTVNKLTLEDAIAIKQIFLQQTHIHQLTYDPMVTNEDDIIQGVEDELSRWPNVGKRNDNTMLDLYNKHTNKPKTSGKYLIHNKSTQFMTSLCFKNESEIMATSLGNAYLLEYADTSLTNIIREKNGLTYGLQFYRESILGDSYTSFACDVSRGTEDTLMRVFKESINASVDSYTPEQHAELVKITEVRRILAYVDAQQYEYLHGLAIDQPEQIIQFEQEYATDIQTAIDMRFQKYCKFDAIKQHLLNMQRMVNDGDYSTITN